jgi:hypothetical protein
MSNISALGIYPLPTLGCNLGAVTKAIGQRFTVKAANERLQIHFLRVLMAGNGKKTGIKRIVCKNARETRRATASQ